MQIARQGLLSGALLAFHRSHLDVRRHHVRLHQELPPGGIHSDNLRRRERVKIDKLQARNGRPRLKRCSSLHGDQRASPPRPRITPTGRR